MCIASFCILDNNVAVYTFTRDERADRPFSYPSWINENVFAPLDLEAGGTWIGYNKTRIISLQNGGVVKHKRELPYDLSRGVLVRDFLIHDNLDKFINQLKDKKIEPFTMNVINIWTQKINVYTFNGDFLNAKSVENDKFINCSSTLYDEDFKQNLTSEFEASSFSNEDEIWDFHFSHRIGTKNNPRIQPSSSSITQFILGKNVACRFSDLLRNSEKMTFKLS